MKRILHNALAETFLGFLLLIGSPNAVLAEDFKLPDAAELETFSRDAMPFYVAGIASLDRADYENSYSSLAKAAQLQPYAVKLNRIVAALSVKLGRTKAADQAREFYETAIVSYQNILRHPDLDDSLRREMNNRLKVAVDERDNLAQRDAKRESFGAYFIQELNRSYVASATRAEAVTSPTPAAPVGVPVVTPIVPGGFQGAPVVAGVPTPAYPSAVPTPLGAVPPATAPLGLPPAPGGPQPPQTAPLSIPNAGL